jgi:two-component system phosphate regulon sensor histidine kinase PhoR
MVERWRRADLEPALAPALARLWSRRAELGVALAIGIVFVIAGGLSPRVAVLGLVAVTLCAALWPVDEAAEGRRAAAVGETQTSGERLWRAVIDAVPEPTVVLDSGGYVIRANRLASDLFGSRRRGGHFASLSRAPELLEAVDHALASGDTVSIELHERVPVERRLLATIAPLEGSRADIASADPALLLSFRDLSEQDRLTRMRADFVANASHELRTPLASLRGFVETLQGAAKDDAAARERFLKVMAEQAERMTRLIDDLLSLSRVEMREHLPLVEEVDLNEAVAHVIQTLQPIAAQAGTSIEFAGLPEPAIIRGDRDEIVQVFQNLVQNAIKYGKPGGRIEVQARREAAGGGRPARFVVAVKDDGPGIAPQHLPRLTERFYRVNAAASREKGGTGLGLAIVKHILNRHRGEIAIASELGHGATFAVTLPAKE